MHQAAFSGDTEELSDAGLYRFRKGAELHASSPEVVRRLHAHVRAPGAKTYSAFEELTEHQVPQKDRSEEHTSELQSLAYLVCRLLLEKKNQPSHQRVPD